MPSDDNALRYAGLLGHRYVVVTGPPHDRRLRAQSDDIGFVRQLQADYAQDHATLYRRDGSRWVPVK